MSGKTRSRFRSMGFNQGAAAYEAKPPTDWAALGRNLAAMMLCPQSHGLQSITGGEGPLIRLACGCLRAERRN